MKKLSEPQPNVCGHSIFKEECLPCRRLRKEWYTHLKATGFADIEKRERLTDHKSPLEIHSRVKDFLTQDTYDARLSYYQWCQSMVNTGKFDSVRDKLIWEDHAEGISRRKIAKNVDLEQSYVTRKIHKIQHSLVNQVVGSVSLTEGALFKIV